jgi:hypothetical protein
LIELNTKWNPALHDDGKYNIGYGYAFKNANDAGKLYDLLKNNVGNSLKVTLTWK